MSFDIFLQLHSEGGSYKIPFGDIHRRFAGHIEAEQPGFWRLSFDDGQEHGEVFTDVGDLIDGFMVARPPHSLEFWQIVAGVLRDCPGVLWWPSPKGTCPIVGKPETIHHLPKAMIEALGAPIVSTDPEFIRNYVEENS